MIPGQFSDIPAATSDDIGSPDVYIAQRIEQREPILANPGAYLFSSIRTPKRPMSDNTLNAALRHIGYGHDK